MLKKSLETYAGRPVANLSFNIMQRQIHALRRTGVAMLHTARPFSFYRRIFYQGASEKQLIKELAGKRILDVGCGYTPYIDDSMFQICAAHGIEFYAADPLLADPIKFGVAERVMARAFGSRARFSDQAPGLHRTSSASAQLLPFDDNSLDEILCSYLLFVWIEDEAVLNEIFNEFHRVLKAGASAKIYPYIEWQRADFKHPEFLSTLEKFNISQQFITGGFNLRVPPSWLTIFRKKASELSS